MDPQLPRLVALLALLALVTLAAGRLKTPPPVLLAGAGLAAALIPGLPRTPLHPDLILVFFLPPLLYADAFQTSWVDFRRWMRPILMLAVGLVIATTLAVGFVAQAVLPGVSPAACFVLGAVVSPTDTVAVQAVIERLRVPRRITAILGGESLVNDATGLVAVQVGVAVIASGTFELGHAALEFARIAGIGVAVGIATGSLFAWINCFVRDVRTLFALSLLSPYATFWLAHLFGASGVLSVVVAGFVVSWRIHRLHADARVELYASWDSLVYVLNGLCFLLVGLEAPRLLDGISHRQDLMLAALAVSAAVVVTRIAWTFPGAYLPLLLSPYLRKREGGMPTAGGVLLVSWAGVRGAVSLAAALALPADFPGRAEIVVCAMIVVLCTLLVQGLTLTPLIHLLGLRGDDDTADEIRHARESYLQAGIERLDQFCSQNSCPIEVFHLRSSMEDELETLREVDSERRTHARARLSVSQEVRRAVVDAQRDQLLALRDQGKINDMTYMELLLELDRQSLAMQTNSPA